LGLPVRQTSFLAGELDPRLWGRTDLEIFGKGARRLRNFFPSSRGTVSRPGTTYCGLTKDQAAAYDKVCLVPFIYADSQSFVLEFGVNYIRFWTKGALITNAGPVYEVATPFANPELLRFVQSGDVLTIADTNYNNAPYELRRLSNTNWQLSTVLFASQLPYFTAPNYPGVIYTFPAVVATSVTTGGVTVLTLPTGDTTHPPRDWVWGFTITAKDLVSGATFETQAYIVTKYYDGTDGAGNPNDADHPSNLAAGQKLAPYPDQPVTLKLGLTSAGVSDPNAGAGGSNYTCLGFNVYRGLRNGPMGYVGSIAGDALNRTFVDYGDAPDYAVQPPRGQSPFNAGEVPGAVTYYQERIVYGGSFQRPNWVWLSTTGDYRNFDDHTLPTSGEALKLALASRRREVVRDLVPHTKLLILTDSTVRSLAGSNGPLDYNNIDSRLEMEIGCGQLGGALVVGNQVLFPRAKGIGVHGLAYSWQSQGYVGRDLSSNAQHLFVGAKQPNGDGDVFPQGPMGLTPRTIRSWTYAKDPWGLVWAITADGSLVSLTLEGADAGWARHDTDGWYVSIASIPEIGPSGAMEDFIYATVIRKLNGSYRLCVERFTSRVQYGTVDDNICLDCARKYSGALTTTLTGLNDFIGKDVYVTGKGNPVSGPLTVSNTGTITLPDVPTGNNPDGSVTLYVGLLFTPEVETLDFAPPQVRTRQKQVVEIGFEVDNSQGLELGQDFDHLVPWEERDVDDGYGAVAAASDIIVAPVQGTFDLHARAALRQTLPLPVTILGLTRLIDVGDGA
jgi:hypothetical protein